MNGHLFVIDGDLQKIACDAWLLPTDRNFEFTRTWDDTLKRIATGRLETILQDGWRGRHSVYLDTIDGADVWLGDVGRNDAPIKHYVECARDFVVRASRRCAESGRAVGRLPVVAINHLGTGAGGARERHGRILQALIRDLTDDLNAGRLSADVVLVSWGEQSESAAQYFRSHLTRDWRDNPQWDFGPDTQKLHMVAEELAQHLLDARLSVFLGAGTSQGAGLPGWKTLLHQVAQEAGILDAGEDLEDLEDLRDRAALIDARLRRAGNRSLHDLLTDGLAGSKYSLIHGLLSSFPCNEFITTNVDELFEIACRTAGRSLTVMPHKEGDNRRWLLKLHGSISEPETMVFTRESFLDAGRNSRALLGLVQAMLFTRHMLFVGYGLGDEDFHELVYEVRRAFGGAHLTEPIGTVLSIRSEPLKADIWRDTLRIVTIGGSASVDEAARDVSRFLDLVGMLAADKYRFFLDDRYAYDFFEYESELRDQLINLVELGIGASTPAGREIRALLERLGWHG